MIPAIVIEKGEAIADSIRYPYGFRGGSGRCDRPERDRVLPYRLENEWRPIKKQSSKGE